jgi:hypothetical protein
MPINKGADGPLDYNFDIARSIPLPGAHSEEIVRDLFTDVHVRIGTHEAANPRLMRFYRPTQHTHAEKTAKFAPGKEKQRRA